MPSFRCHRVLKSLTAVCGRNKVHRSLSVLPGGRSAIHALSEMVLRASYFRPKAFLRGIGFELIHCGLEAASLSIRTAPDL
jgi:hypothetical protein